MGPLLTEELEARWVPHAPRVGERISSLVSYNPNMTVHVTPDSHSGASLQGPLARHPTNQHLRHWTPRETTGAYGCWHRRVCVCVCVCACVRAPIANCLALGVIQTMLCSCLWQFMGALWTHVQFKLRLVREVSTAHWSLASCLLSNLVPGLVASAVHSAFSSVFGG